MAVTLSPVVSAQERRIPGFRSLQFVDLDRLGIAASPVAVLDDFLVGGLPFTPHPHAGFSAVTYVFEDSPGSVRSRTSAGIGLTIPPGGIVWTHAGSGVVHEEAPAEPGKELHGVQLFVNLSAKNKLSRPEVFAALPQEIPTWTSQAQDRVRVVVGEFGNVKSPLEPPESFTLLDVSLRSTVILPLAPGDNGVLYVRSGGIVVRSESGEASLERLQAVAVSGDGTITLSATSPAELLVLAGRRIEDPVISDGPFIMNSRAQIEDAISRFRRGEMGNLLPAKLRRD